MRRAAVTAVGESAGCLTTSSFGLSWTGQQLMVAAYTVSGDSFRAEKPRLWAEGYIGPQTGHRSFDLHPDGERVAVAPELGSFDRPQDRLVFIFNSFDELRRVPPTGSR